MAALAGPTLDVPLLCRACDRSEEEVVALLEDAAAYGLIGEESDRLIFAIGARESLLACQLTVRRVLRHKRLARVADDPDTQAYHLGQAGAPEAGPLLKAAGDRAMLAGERQRALGFYRRTLELSPVRNAELVLLTALCGMPELLEEAAATADAVVGALARYHLALRPSGVDGARALRSMDRAHKELAQLWRNERLERLLELTEGRARQVAGAPGGLALAYWWSGRPAEAEVIVRESLMEGGTVAQGALEQWVLASVATLRGDLDEAFRRYAQAVDDAVLRRDFGAAARWAGEWLDLLAFTRGAGGELATRVKELCARAGLAVAPGSWSVAVACGSGAPGRPPRYGEYAEAMWGMSLRGRACLEAGELSQARTWLETVDAWHAGPRPSLWCYALNRVEWARWHMAAGDPAAAGAAAEEALELGERFGAPAALVEPALGLLGRGTPTGLVPGAGPAGGPAVRAPRSAATGLAPVPQGLSAREAEVAALVAQGLTDREIGERLFISPRTVDGHLRNIFRKLDLPSRTALAAWVLSFPRHL